MSQGSEIVQITLYQPNVGPTTHVLASPTVTLGRSSDCTIPIKDRFLSRHHAELLKNGKVLPNTKTAAFQRATKMPVYAPLSGRTMEFDGAGHCVAGC